MISPLLEVVRTRQSVSLPQNATIVARGTEARDPRYVTGAAWPVFGRRNRTNLKYVIMGLHDYTATVESKRRGKEAERMMSVMHLADGVAHDFRNALGGIMGCAELLARSLTERIDGGTGAPHDPELAEHALSIIASCKRAAHLTTQLLTFSHPDRGESVFASVDLHLLVNDGVSLLLHVLDPRIEIRKMLDAPLSFVHGEASQLRNVIINLAINARDAMENGGTLTYETVAANVSEADVAGMLFPMPSGRCVELRVRDTGVGMTADTIAHALNPFFTTKEHTEGDGKGLGLTTIRTILELHKGSLRIESEPGKGTTVSVFLPLAESADVVASRTIATGSRSTSPRGDMVTKAVGGFDMRTLEHGHGTILMVDDDAVMRVVGRKMLKKLGYGVLLAVDGVEGVERYEECKDDIGLVLLDVVMPRMNGREALGLMRRINPNVKVLICTGFISDEETRAIRALGVHGFLLKPFVYEDLATEVKRVLEAPPDSYDIENGGEE